MLRIRLRILQAEKETREGRTITLRAFAEETGLSTRTLQDLRKGTALGVQFKTLETLCKYFGCSACDLIEYMPDEAEEAA